MSFKGPDLAKCHPYCTECIQDYIKKHNLKRGDEFEIIGCKGIPKEYISVDLANSLGISRDEIRAALNPVDWAAKYLDWHCIDPKGEVWKRKTEENTLYGAPVYNEERAKQGKSPFNRPYQYKQLCCTSRRKVYRIGRQCGKTQSIIIDICFSIYTNDNYNIEIITPFQSQIDLIFKGVLDMIDRVPFLKNSIVRRKGAPNPVIELKNNSAVYGFTAGTRSKQNAGSSRGQHANKLIFDEADMLNAEDFDAAMAVIINHPDACVWVSSTPTGRIDKFYKTCFSRQYKEFFFPSWVNPNWSDELEKFFRAELTEDGYTHEIEAGFGNRIEGVYQRKFILAAQTEYEYGFFTPNPQWTYFMGVDWNDVKIGTTIAVVGLNPSDNCFYLVDKYIISRENRTQLTACNKVTEVNRQWNCAAIYIDAGYGAVQHEILKEYSMRATVQYGNNHPDAQIKDILVAYDFGGTVEVKDPFTKQPVKKPAKPFLVDNSVRRFEQFQFKYPKSDIAFTKELENYIIDRVSITGRPIYTTQDEKVGDHMLDAVNLALVAYIFKKSFLGKVSYTAQIAFAGNFGETDNKAVSPLIDEARSHIPQTNRTSFNEPSVQMFQKNNDLPVSNTMVNSNNVKLWSWPGFLRDEPKPRVRSWSEFLNRTKGPLSRNKPQRKKF